jgi:hypothetical protein
VSNELLEDRLRLMLNAAVWSVAVGRLEQRPATPQPDSARRSFACPRATVHDRRGRPPLRSRSRLNRSAARRALAEHRFVGRTQTRRRRRADDATDRLSIERRKLTQLVDRALQHWIVIGVAHPYLSAKRDRSMSLARFTRILSADCLIPVIRSISS